MWPMPRALRTSPARCRALRRSWSMPSGPARSRSSCRACPAWPGPPRAGRTAWDCAAPATPWPPACCRSAPHPEPASPRAPLPGVAGAPSGGHASVGLRCPAHPVAHALLQACAAPGESDAQGGPPVWDVAAPSANRFGRVSPTTARHVQDELGAELLVLDGGPCEVGIESTIVDCTRGVPVLLRPGAITREQIRAACGIAPLSKDDMPALTPRSSGTLEAHYAPAAKVRLMDAKALQTGLDLLGADAAHIAVYARAALRTQSSKLVMRRMPDDATATAQQLFAVLRGFDDYGVKLIWIETPPTSPEWEGVRDRLQRASAA